MLPYVYYYVALKTLHSNRLISDCYYYHSTIVHIDSPYLLECRGGTWSSQFRIGSTFGHHSLHPPCIPMFIVTELVHDM